MVGERGGVRPGGLLRTILWILIVGVVVYDSLAIAVNRIQLDEMAQAAARAGASAWTTSSSRSAVETAVSTRLASERDVELTWFDVGDRSLFVDVRRPAPVLLAHRVGPLDELVAPVVRKSLPLGR